MRLQTIILASCAGLLGTQLTNGLAYSMHLLERKLEPRHSLHIKYLKKKTSHKILRNVSQNGNFFRYDLKQIFNI